MLLEKIINEITTAAGVAGVNQNLFGIDPVPIRRMKIRPYKKASERKRKKGRKRKENSDKS